MNFGFPSGHVARSANLTPEPETGIGRWSQPIFLNRFALYRNPEALCEVRAGEAKTQVPWSFFAGMSDRDLAAIYDYLPTVPAVRTHVPELRAPLAKR